MPALNFQERFAYLIDGGKKRQTIRPIRKRPIKPGDTLYLYKGMRTKRCKKLGEAICKSVRRIKIETGCVIYSDFRHLKAANIRRKDDLDNFAKRDGLNSWEEMWDWFQKRYGLPFQGVLIEW